MLALYQSVRFRLTLPLLPCLRLLPSLDRLYLKGKDLRDVGWNILLPVNERAYVLEFGAGSF